MTVDFYTQIETRRKSWLPISPKSLEKVTAGAEDTVSRCLALRALELPVKEFILDGLSRPEAATLGEAGRNTLMRNTEDEERHDEALNNCVAVYADYNKSYELEVENILNAWKELPDHPITKVACLENGVFFVLLPILRQFGGNALRTTALDVSADEVLHVQSHRYAAQQLNQRPSTALDKLRKLTVAWMVDKLDVVGYDKDRFIRSSDSLMYKGIAPELQFTQSYTVPAFFERASDTLPYYA